MWIALPFAVLLGRGTEEKLLLWPALSAGAILLERISTAAEYRSGKIFVSEAKENNDVLRQETYSPESRHA